MKADNTYTLSLHPLTLAVALLLLCLTSCTPIREAQQIVAEADSLRTAGVQYTDSTAMADAAATLGHVHLLYPTAYAHANYYYGRILREAGNQPEAMLAFLRVVHSRTQDHVIKARAYSNMGTMSHAASEFLLSYDMYARAAERFMLACDTVSYYYAKNAMALQLAELNLHDETLALLDSITQKCTHLSVIAKTYETKAILYVNTEQYDSALYSVEQLQAYGNHEPTGYVKKAQAFWLSTNYDSAIVYAKKVMDMSYASPRDQYNMLYILTYNDSTIDSEQIRKLSEERSDVDRYIIDPWLTQLTQATQLLQQDLNRKPDLKWLWAILATVLIIGIAITLYVKRKRRKHQLISQQIEDVQAAHHKKVEAEIEIFCQSITDASSLKTTLCWNDFDKMCAIVNSRMFGLADKLKAVNSLNEREIRLCILIALGKFRDKEMAELLLYGEHSFRTVKTMVAKKLGTTGKDLRAFLLEKVVF